MMSDGDHTDLIRHFHEDDVIGKPAERNSPGVQPFRNSRGPVSRRWILPHDLESGSDLGKEVFAKSGVALFIPLYCGAQFLGRFRLKPDGPHHL
jgi:hypothetical protein